MTVRPMIRTAAAADRRSAWALLREGGWGDRARDLVQPDPPPWPLLVAVERDIVGGEAVVGMLLGRYDAIYDPAWCPAGHDGPQAWVFYLYVARSHRRQGIGRDVLAEFTARAAQRGCAYLALGIDRDADPDGQAATAAFFRAMGLQPLPGGESANVHGRELVSGRGPGG